MFEAAGNRSRRNLLRGLAAVSTVPLLAACDLLDREPPVPPPPDPLLGFYAETVVLAALYEAAVSTIPSVVPIRDAHQAHAAALAAIMKPAPSALPASPRSLPTPTASTTATVPTLDTLRQAEQTAREKAMQTGLTVPANRATLLGEIAAARACHVEALT